MKKIVSLVIAVMVFLPCTLLTYAFDEGTTVESLRPDDEVFNTLWPDDQVHDSIDPGKMAFQMGRVESIETISSDGYRSVDKYNLDGDLTESINGYDDYDKYDHRIISYVFDESKLLKKVIQNNYKDANTEIDEYSYSYDDSGRLIERVGHTYGCKYFVEKFKWNNDAKLSEYTIQYWSGGVYREDGYYIKEYIDEEYTEFCKYNDQGKIIETESDYGWLRKYEYDENNRLVKITDEYTDEYTGDISKSQTIERDENERIISYTSEWDNKTTRYEYNSEGLLTKKTDTKNELIVDVTEYKYNEDNQIILETMRGNAGYEQSIEYQYNDKGLLVEEIENTTYSDGSTDNRSWNYKYTYYDEVDMDLDIIASKVVKYEVYDADGASDETVQMFVTSENACVAAAIRDDGSYKLLPSNRTVDPDVHSFTIDTEEYKDCKIAIVKSGDLNLDGKLSINDITMAKAASLSKLDLAPEAKLAADMNGDGVIRANEVAMLRAAALKKAELSW